MLLGDAARIAGNVELSSSEYLGVFEHYRSLPLAESALFSAARVEARAGHSARADQLFARYLAAYPHGQFQAQAREHVHASGKP
jgi:TolA-binding protein